MGDFSYVDIFATKGIEYLFVLGFLLVLILFWRLLNPPQQVAVAAGAATPYPARLSEWFRLAGERYYHPGHSWVMPEGKNVVKVGVDDFAQKLVGTPNAISLPRPGDRLEQGDKGWQLRVDSKSVAMLSPVHGEVLAVNEEILKSPELINQDPYGDGWLMKVSAPRLKANLRNLLSGKLARAWMHETEKALREKMTGGLGLALQDGGVPVAGIAKNLSPDSWDEIAGEFLLSRELRS